MTRPRAGAATVVALASALLMPIPAPAAPSGSRIEAVFVRDRCKAQPCEAGRDPQVAADSPVRGTIQVHVRSSASVLGLDWVRLEARFCDTKVCDPRKDDPRWACIEQWDSPGETSFARTIDWETRNWHFPRGKSPPEPWGCPETTWHWHGAPTENAWFTLRVLARERVNGEEEVSGGFRFRMANPASRPQWVRSPVVANDSSGRPTVTLEWKPNPEPDVVEYHFARTGPGGPFEFAVDADEPQKQGCRTIRLGSPPKVSSLVCEDGAFPETSFSGTFRYAVYAYRPAPSGKSCSMKPQQPCYESQASSVRSVAVSGSGIAAGGATAAPESSVPAATASAAPTGPTPVAVAPVDRQELASPPAGPKRTTILPYVLGILVVGGGASVVTRIVRRRRREA